MRNITIELKSKFDNHDKIRTILKSINAEYLGIDFQTDTYFNVKNGSIKLREGNVESHLIHESNEDSEDKDVLLYDTNQNSSLKEILKRAYGIHKIIEKHREVYVFENVRFYIDFVTSLGNFVGIEAVGKNSSHTKDQLLKQCSHYVELFGLEEWEYVQNSYSDMIDKLSDKQSLNAA